MLGDGVVVDVRGPGEWIVAVPGSERPLHIYRLAADDWLVSEVGRSNEGRATDLKRALAALAAAGLPADWWELVAVALGSNGRSP